MRLFADNALTPGGWRSDVAIDVAADGTIERVDAGSSPDGAERFAGPVVPGMPNLHSHAFQRAIAGRTGYVSAEGDSFWTWRQAMYSFLDRVDADAIEAIATETYVEMLKAGYTSVAEFHYVHHDPRGNAYADPAELAHRIVAAARAAGIALTLLPVSAARRRLVDSAASCTRSTRMRGSSTCSRTRQPPQRGISVLRRTASAP
jgi:formimidoylglutamate deiminase